MAKKASRQPSERSGQPSPHAGPPAHAASPAVRPTDWKRHLLCIAGLCAVALAAYSNSFHSDFVYDNRAMILEDPRVHAATSGNLQLIWSQGYWYPVARQNLYRPLVTLSYLFNYSVLGNGARPAGYH